MLVANIYIVPVEEYDIPYSFNSERTVMGMSENTVRGLLTEQERKFLTGDATDVANTRKIRRQIRKRVEAGLADLSLIYEELEERDVRQIETGYEQKSTGPFPEEYLGTIGLIYRIAEANDIDSESLFWEGLYSSHVRVHPDEIAKVDLSITTESPEDVSRRVQRKISQDRPLTDLELRTLLSKQPDLDDELRDAVIQSQGNNLFNLEQLVREDITRLEDGLKIIDDDLPASNSSNPKPDILAQDDAGNMVLIDIVSEEDTPRQASSLGELTDELTNLAESYGAPGRVRTILAVPFTDTIPEAMMNSTSLEIKSIFDDRPEVEAFI